MATEAEDETKTGDIVRNNLPCPSIRSIALATVYRIA